MCTSFNLKVAQPCCFFNVCQTSTMCKSDFLYKKPTDFSIYYSLRLMYLNQPLKIHHGKQKSLILDHQGNQLQRCVFYFIIFKASIQYLIPQTSANLLNQFLSDVLEYRLKPMGVFWYSCFGFNARHWLYSSFFVSTVKTKSQISMPWLMCNIEPWCLLDFLLPQELHHIA